MRLAGQSRSLQQSLLVLRHPLALARRRNSPSGRLNHLTLVRAPVRSLSMATPRPISSATCRSARFPQLPAAVQERSTAAAASFRRPTKHTVPKMSSTPASSSPAPPTGQYSAPSMAQSRCWSFFRAAPRAPDRAGHRPRRGVCRPTIRAASSASTGASIRHRRRCTRRRSACAIRPPRLDHDALADSVLDHRTVYHFYSRDKWTLIDMPD